jgi:hypothetical protein
MSYLVNYKVLGSKWMKKDDDMVAVAGEPSTLISKLLKKPSSADTAEAVARTLMRLDLGVLTAHTVPLCGSSSVARSGHVTLVFKKRQPSSSDSEVDEADDDEEAQRRHACFLHTLSAIGTLLTLSVQVSLAHMHTHTRQT